ncbi:MULTISPECIES: azurin [Halomonadaceae]|uniref:azurin n=1 Tax=Halomonadaceae TaxID=28256 RepID=UPI00159AE8B9|nr:MULTISPECIES: azurin [Halomonas]QJQ95749.1 azurin [Halomonas sp. PA5]
MLRKLLVASALCFASLPVLAAQCEVDVDSTDQMTFDTDAIEISQSCDTFTVNLHHSGTMSKDVMGHNWVLTKSSDVNDVARAGIAAGLDNDYLEPGDERVIAYTDVIGGGETTSVSFDVAKLEEGEEYTFFCSFPGHFAMMRGSVSLVD